ncbi:hypothetical protein [Rarobacter incanus]|uniref:Uncharacterized protein n=1 Tax=Rarobacter incanus TaxID=153494 RepID=A0A542SP63_9MICO|nr:hypothetical protein [Rarobacter incanus]TQK76403.1 hypothetical protein FB389_1074 [Rarobacter incanus]
MRSVIRGIGWAGLVGGVIAEWAGPPDRSYIPFIVIGAALIIASTQRRRREETDYTAAMLASAGYKDPDESLPAGVESATKPRSRGGIGFLVFLIVLGAILWPIRADIVEHFGDSTGATSPWDSSQDPFGFQVDD